GAVANAIREDPRQRGLLYASTDQQVWVSFDDGDHWQSLRLNMPAISVRDIQLKDDSSCLCADLIAGTHGRGYWILDDVTPLRQMAAVRSAQQAYLVKPKTAVRVRFGTNDPTPWSPEVPAGENPPPGGIIDYYLASDAAGPVTLDVLDGAGKVVRSYSSADPVRTPHPALDPEAYDRLCQRTPTAAYCGLPMYWPAPPMVISTAKGMHRVSWDLRWQPVLPDTSGDGDEDAATGAVPHRTYPPAMAPWAPPGTYTVRLTVGGKSFTQPLTLRLDPRVKTPAAGLARLASLSRSAYDAAVATQAAYAKARALAAALDSVHGADADAFKARLDSLAPAAGAKVAPRRRGAPTPAPTLPSARDALIAAAMAMQGADVTPTAAEEAAVTKARTDANAVTARWTTLRTSGLAALNAKRKAAGLPALVVPGGDGGR
ncbi:MAG TPA: hypothetical protein VNS52_11535, partial [Gemmatimonadaceae bacterium]|nr:hypothetical protein [Gemmatimonadaceae bacterium]